MVAEMPAAPPRPGGYEHRRTDGEVRRCKKGHRSELKYEGWEQFLYAGEKGDKVIAQPIVTDGVRTLPIPRVRRGDITVEEFFLRFSLPRRPCIIEDGMKDWPAMQRWSMDLLMEELRHTSLKVGEDDRGRKLRMKFKYFMDYMKNQRDDSPLYLFETRPENDPQARKLLDDFEVPDLFPHDFFDLVNPHSKPPYRWWSIGPKRSGTTVHADPLGTAAWNAVTHGRKRWVLFEPQVDARIAKGKDVINTATEDDEAVMYFDFLLPRIKEKHPDIRIYEGVQGPGEIIYVPGEWWHGVLNLEDTVAVTQNYCGYDNFDRVWERTRKERLKLAHLWLRNMRRHAPQLHSRALELNKRDGFRMRHEKSPNEPPSDSESDSSSSSSSDSSSDCEKDLDLSRVNPKTKIIPPWLATSQASPTPPPMRGSAGYAPPPSAPPPLTSEICRKRPHGGATPEAMGA